MAPGCAAAASAGVISPVTAAAMHAAWKGAGTNEGCGVAAGHWSHCHAAKAYITAVAAMPSRVTSLAICFFLRVPGAGLG